MSNSPKQHESPCNAAEDEIVLDLIHALPPLPPLIRYYDELEEKIHTIREPSKQAAFSVSIRGRKCRLNFRAAGSINGMLWKHVFSFLLSEDLSVTTAYNYCRSGLDVKPNLVAEIISAGPVHIATSWSAARVAGMDTGALTSLKALVRMMCRFRLHGWSDSYVKYLEQALPYPHKDKYAGVRSGNVFLDPMQEAAIVRFLDEMANRLARSEAVIFETHALADAAMLACAYQFGMRPHQIAMLRRNQARIWQAPNEGAPTVHLTFHMAKQRTSSARKPLTRKVKREWNGLFSALIERAACAPSDQPDSLFQIRSTQEVAQRISRLTKQIIGSDQVGCATDLRHTAAQRLVDAGANHEELAEFMGHSCVTTGLVYFDVSASHAERVNRALGASDVYQRVARIALDRFIAPAELIKLKQDQQIAGVPHGTLITGIGACTSGQPNCLYNPITSCYGCQKFLPVRDRFLHARVLVEMRQTVLQFEAAGRSNGSSPAFLQLQRTINEIQSVLDTLEDTPQ